MKASSNPSGRQQRQQGFSDEPLGEGNLPFLTFINKREGINLRNNLGIYYGNTETITRWNL